jgi:hypothetical protein
MLGGSGVGEYQILDLQEAQISDDSAGVAGAGAIQQQVRPNLSEDLSSSPVIEEAYPPVYIDPRVLTITGAQ